MRLRCSPVPQPHTSTTELRTAAPPPPSVVVVVVVVCEAHVPSPTPVPSPADLSVPLLGEKKQQHGASVAADLTRKIAERLPAFRGLFLRLLSARTALRARAPAARNGASPDSQVEDDGQC